MCQIHMLMNLNGSKLTKEDREQFFRLMALGSVENSDAFGLFNSKFLFKHSKHFNPSKFESDEILRDNFIVGHNRLSFGGNGIGRGLSACETVEYERESKHNISSNTPWVMDFVVVPNPNPRVKKEYRILPEELPYRTNDYATAVRNHHPFILNDLVLVHNGIINNTDELRNTFRIQSDVATDTFTFLWLVNHFQNASRKPTREKKLIEAIQRTTRIVDGSYSIFIYDKLSKSLYYFKNFSTDFNFKVIGNMLCGTTSKVNLNHVYYGEKRKNIEIEENKIYKITQNVRRPIIEIAKFKESKLFMTSSFYDEEAKSTGITPPERSVLEIVSEFIVKLVLLPILLPYEIFKYIFIKMKGGNKD